MGGQRANMGEFHKGAPILAEMAGLRMLGMGS